MVLQNHEIYEAGYFFGTEGDCMAYLWVSACYTCSVVFTAQWIKKINDLISKLDTEGYLNYIILFIACIILFEVIRWLAKLKRAIFRPRRIVLSNETTFLLRKALIEGELDTIQDFVEKHPQSVKWMFEYTDKDYPSDVTLLYLAVLYNKLDIAKLLLSKGAVINKRAGISDHTPLEIAIVNKNTEMTEYLISKGGEFRLKSFKDEIPGEILTLLSDSRTRAKYDDIFKAVEKSSIMGVRDWLARGVDVNIKDNHGQTPLHLAAIKGGTEITKILVNEGARVNVKDELGNTPLMLAMYYGYKEIEGVLRKYGAVDESGQ